MMVNKFFPENYRFFSNLGVISLILVNFYPEIWLCA